MIERRDPLLDVYMLLVAWGLERLEMGTDAVGTGAEIEPEPDRHR